MYSYTKPGLTTGKRLLMDRYHEEQENVYRIADLRITRTYDNEGRVATQSGAGGNYSYGYNSMGRPNRLTQTVTPAYDIISAAQYGPGGQMTSLTRRVGEDSYTTETMQYNVRGQLTRMTMPNAVDLEYRYSAAQNNGRITSYKEYLSGEEVTYQYGTTS
jgi:YD repeat-containing protein